MTISKGHTPAPGSTLIGAMVSLLILSIGMTALFRLYINNSVNSAYSHHLSTALAYASDKIEQLRYDDNISNTTGSEQLQHQNLSYQRIWTISHNNDPDYRLINVTMEWQDSSGKHDIALNTIISGQTPDTLAFDEKP